MKKRILILGLALTVSFSFAQKKELKKAERAIKSEKYSDALNHLKGAESSISGADQEMQAKYYALRGEALAGSIGSNYDTATAAAEAFARAFEINPRLRATHEQGVFIVRRAIINAAVRDQNSEQYEKAAQKLKTSYAMTDDPSDLYFAASNYVNAQKLDLALETYQRLLDMNYTGQETEYVATDKATGEVVVFDDENLRNIAMRTGDYVKPTTRKTDSKKGEILRNMTLIYIQQGENEKAKSLMASARAENPNDVHLMRAEADMSYNMGDMKKYNQLMNKIVETDPDNPEIHFNLGVASAQLGENEKAEQYYKKALELNPNYEGALINMAVIKLANEAPIVEQMNSLGTSRADNLKYDELRSKLEKLRQEALPYLEKAQKINPNNAQVTRTLMNIYSQIGDDKKEAEMRNRLKSLE